MFVSIMSFFAQISDPSVGGTYMTLLNTICNLGGNWPSTVALWLVDPLTTKVCEKDSENDCSSAELEKVTFLLIDTYIYNLHVATMLVCMCKILRFNESFFIVKQRYVKMADLPVLQ